MTRLECLRRGSAFALPRVAKQCPSLLLCVLLCLPVAGWAATITHSAAGEVTASSAIVWGRCDAAATLHVEYVTGDGPAQTAAVPVTAEHDFTGSIPLAALAPGSSYRYSLRCGDDGVTRTGAFRTAPPVDSGQAVRFSWSGDLGGQNTCRDLKVGYAIFDAIAAREPDFFIALGDMIYADDPCPPRSRYNNEQVVGLDHPAVSLRDFWDVWRYHRSDAAFQRLLDRVPILPTWDDHETMNDAGPHRDTYPENPGIHLLPTARAAFLDYQPFIPPADDPTRLYRSLRWGQHVEVFVLDMRGYRDAKDAVDDPQAMKSLLGATQREWFVRQITASDATWKIVVSSVPVSIPTCGPRGCDGWANRNTSFGYENELRAILQSLRAAHVHNMVWLTTDVHFATGFRYTPFPDDRDFQFVEFVAGPLNAGVFPQNDFDLTLGTERLFFYGPTQPQTVTTFEALRPWFNFGVIDVSPDGDLRMQIVNGEAKVVAEQKLVPR